MGMRHLDFLKLSQWSLRRPQGSSFRLYLENATVSDHLNNMGQVDLRTARIDPGSQPLTRLTPGQICQG
jgi:hypothetical protein